MMETAVAARGRVWRRPAVGQGTNDHAEWQALLNALEVAVELGATDIVLLGDSAFVVGQATGALETARGICALSGTLCRPELPALKGCASGGSPARKISPGENRAGASRHAGRMVVGLTPVQGRIPGTGVQSMKMLGLIGGMSWKARAGCYRIINQGVRERCGPTASARCLLWSFDFAEIAILQTAGDWDTLAVLLVDAGEAS